MLGIYRILTYLLLPVAMLFVFFALMFLMGAMGNISLLLPLFLISATVLYILFSFRFLQNGILPNQQLKPSLKDWIRVNGFIALFIGSMLLVQGYMVRNNTEIKEQFELQYESFKEQVPQQEEMPNINLEKLLQSVLIFMMVIGALIVGHVMFTLQFLRKYQHLFEVKQLPADDEGSI